MALAMMRKSVPSRFTVEPDRIFVRDGRLYTSAGVTAGVDLALGLIEEDHGRTVALGVARRLVMFVKRSGSQSQFSSYLAAQISSELVIQEVQAWILDNLTADLSIRTLAERAKMSTRNFARIFRKEVHATPLRFVEMARLDVARRTLEESSAPMKRVASRSGFGSAEAMRRVFVRRLSITPVEYREQYLARSNSKVAGRAA
jgi:transcriptional regulator GlxA family with amidase domain